MNIRLLLVALLFVAAPLAGLRAQSDAKPKPAATEESTPLEDTMEKVNGAFRVLKRQVNDASKNEDSLKRATAMREAAEAALKLEPAMKADKPAADQAKFVAQYQAGIKTMIEGIAKLEAALKAGNNAEAAKIVAELEEGRKAGHKEFKRPAAKK